MEAVLMEKKNVYSRMDKGILNTLKDILSPYEKSTYKVAVHEFNALRFAWYQDGKFIFPDDESVAIEDFSLQYVLQLRFFNQDPAKRGYLYIPCHRRQRRRRGDVRRR